LCAIWCVVLKADETSVIGTRFSTIFKENSKRSLFIGTHCTHGVLAATTVTTELDTRFNRCRSRTTKPVVVALSIHHFEHLREPSATEHQFVTVGGRETLPMRLDDAASLR